MVAVPRIRRPLRIAQHVIKALLPWLFPAHQIFERARYSASKLFHFDSYSRNSCSDAARESIALNNDVIEDCAALSFSRSFPAPNLGSDGSKLLNVSRNSVRSLPKALQSVLLIFNVEFHIIELVVQLGKVTLLVGN
ncbi:hypothetical protein GMA89_13945, partial [Turicibacter sanguinis]|nr:hypothetical protein [Turicibacter sanguinis]